MSWKYMIACWLYKLACFTVIIKGMRHDDQLRFTTQPEESVYIQNNRSFFVPCKAVGVEPVRKYWRNESTLNTNVVINATDSGLWFPTGVDCMLGFRRVGIFRCIASNTAGVVISKKFQLNFIYLQNVSVNLSSAVLFGNVVRLKCSVESNQPVNYTWYKNGRLLNVSHESRMETLPSGVLRIKDYKGSDDGDYSCQAKNEDKAITSGPLKVIGQSASNTNIHIYPGKVIHTTVGHPLVIECIQQGPQKSSVSWSKVGGNSKLAEGAGYANYVFESIREADGGEYRCQVTGGVLQTLFISVGVPPSFTKKLPAITKQKEGERLVLACDVRGRPIPSIMWYKDGQVLEGNHRVRLYENKLELRNVELEDQGIYQCEIENEHGSRMDQTRLVVIERMDPPSGVKGRAISTTRIKVTWKIPPGYKSVLFVAHFFDYMRNTYFSKISQYNATSVVVDQLKPYTNYAIYVKMYADNRERGQCQPFLVTTKESKPSDLPNVVKFTSYSEGTVDLTWLPPLLFHRNGKITGYEIIYWMVGDQKRFNLTVGEKVYSATLGNLVKGEKYRVDIAAKTKEGVGPFSEHTVVITKTSHTDVIAPPSVTVKNVNTTIVISVSPPPVVDVKGYQLTYRFLEDRIGRKTEVVKYKKSFDYELKKIEMKTSRNLEYVISVAAFKTSGSLGRPAIAVVAAKNTPIMINRTVFTSSNYTDLPSTRITCEPTLNLTALHVRLDKVSMEYMPKFEVTYFILNDPKNTKTILTKYSNVTIPDVLPGNVYAVQVKTIFRKHPVSSYSTSRLQLCQVPEKEPETPPSKITCNISGTAIIFEWEPPTKPNGRIIDYHIMWYEVGRKGVNEQRQAILKRDSLTIQKFERSPNFTVYISAKNSAGQSPLGYCIVDTSKIEGPLKPGGESDDEGASDNTDIKKGIIIGCIISFLVLFLLVLFVCWSGCRRRKPAQIRTCDGENSTGLPYFNVTGRTYPDTASTDVSEISSKHHMILKKYLDEETSKESDRGVGMTPKGSRLYLDCEKLPFLPRAAADHGGSVDTSCDSQDSGVQGFGTKLSPLPKALKDPDKAQLQEPEDSVIETVF